MTTPTILMTGALGAVARMIRPPMLARYGSLLLTDRAATADLSDGEDYRPANLEDADRLVEITRGIEAVVHLGGKATEGSWEEILKSNIEGLHNLYEACRINGVKRIVFASSNHAIGFYPRNRRLTVDHRVRPDSRYGVSKAFGEALGALYAMKHGLGVLDIRIGHVAARPADHRRLSIWIHPEDLVSLVAIGIEHPDIVHEVVWGTSANERGWWDNAPAFRLGYRPVHRAEDHRDHALAEQERIAPDPVADTLQGGPYCSAEFDGDPDRIL